MIDRQISNEISRERERAEKRSHAVGLGFFFLLVFSPRAAAVYQCTKPTITHLWIFITPQRLGGMDSNSRARAATHAAADVSGVDPRDSVVRPLRSRTQKEQRVLSHCDSLTPPSCPKTRARIAHTHRHVQMRARRELVVAGEHVAMAMGERRRSTSLIKRAAGTSRAQNQKKN